MRERVRTWFSAPLVVVTAGCSSGTASKNPTEDFATVHQRGTACTYSPAENCPKGALCNPPPPQPIECPAGVEKDAWARIGHKPGGQPGECVVLLDGCYDLACAKDVPCPDLAHDRTLPPLQWAINPGEGADAARCTATPGARTDFDQPPPAVTIDCPASLTERHGFIERATITADCYACATPPCAADAAATVPCPQAAALPSP